MADAKMKFILRGGFMVRDKRYDFLKGIGILLVLFNHSSPPALSWVVGAFHMPFFFIISGILCKKQGNFAQIEPRNFLYKKLKAFLMPYYFFGILDAIVYCIVSPELFGNFSGMIKEIGYYLLGMRSINIYYFTGALWFLTALFSCQICFYIIERYLQKRTKFIIFLALISVAVYLKKYSIVLPYNMDTIPYTISFFAFGYYFGDKIDIFIKSTGRRYLLALVIGVPVFLCLVRLNGNIDIFSRKFGSYIILFLLNGITGTLLTMSIFSIIYDHVNILYLRDGILFTGKYSLYYLAIHQQLVIHPLNAKGVILDNSVANFTFRFLLSLGASTIITFIILKALNSLKR